MCIDQIMQTLTHVFAYSYQDGYFNGDYGTDEDDLINQCWKFYSHDSYHCNYECQSMADAQGTINEVRIGSKYYGTYAYPQIFLNFTMI